VSTTYRAQAHLDAPREEVWALVGDPNTYPDWFPFSVDVQGRAVEVGDVYHHVAEYAGRRLEYDRIIERRDELKTLRWHCPTTGTYQQWLLTDVQGGTFVDMEMGIRDPESSRFALLDKTVGRWFVKSWAEKAIDGLRRTLSSGPTER
jgi:uncharacterized protein YndB with AHSA1/START domain